MLSQERKIGTDKASIGGAGPSRDNGIPGRPNRPLVVRCGYDGSTRRINFPSAAVCRLESLKLRVEECFALAACSFFFTYTDDDGEDFPIRSDSDLTEAIAYFVSGDDDHVPPAPSTYSNLNLDGNGGVGGGIAGERTSLLSFGPSKIHMRVDVVVEYDGPSLSDTSSIRSFETFSSQTESTRTGTNASIVSKSDWKGSDMYHAGRKSLSSRSSSFSGDVYDASEEVLGRDNSTSSDRTIHDQRSLVDPFNDVSISARVLSSDWAHASQIHHRSNSFESSGWSSGSPPSQQTSGPRRRSEKMRSNDSSIYSSFHRTSTPVNDESPQDEEATPQREPLASMARERVNQFHPSLLTNSELGSRWLREQSQLARRKISGLKGPGATLRRYDSDDDSLGSDEEAPGDIALVRDARGKFYYSYQSTETSSLSSQSELDFDSADIAGPSHRPVSGFSSSSSSTITSSPPETPYEAVNEPTRIAEPMGPPILAPDCSACGIRLDHMRYVCLTCGECDMWTVNAVGKTPFVPPPPRLNDSEDGGSSEWEGDGSESRERDAHSRSTGSSAGSRTVYYAAGGSRSRSGSISTNASRGSIQALNGSAVSPTDGRFSYIINRGVGGLTPPDSPNSPSGGTAGDGGVSRQHSVEDSSKAHRYTHRRPTPPRGYELCAGCIELHGIAHSKAAAKEERLLRQQTGRRKKRAVELRHTFREKIWAAEGWVDVDYSEDTECSICKTKTILNRFRCVSCPKFDLCRSCYQKVDEIHPVHAFLSLPDPALPAVGPLGSQVLLNEPREPVRPVRHPGAFCHNCLQDIVGPRFHCAVCPSWDLCIQCEGVSAPGGESHTADHIMMKIPIPLESAAVEAVSRRARERWFQHDLSTVAAAFISSPVGSAINSNGGGGSNSPSRSSSPTNDTETVYVPTNSSTQASNAAALAAAMRNGTDLGRTLHAPGAGAGPLRNQVSQGTSSAGIGMGRRVRGGMGIRDDLDHEARCSNCKEWIMGKRFQCANCTSDPEPYNLCSICELRSYRVHDPRHVFFKFDRPVHIPLQSRRPFLPILYKSQVGEIPNGVQINPRDSTAYLKYVLHKYTLCDIHQDQIRGIWLRCAHCAAGFDICQEAEQIADHDATHVFVVFKGRVNMSAFRQFADLAATHSKPLLTQQVYLS